MHKSLITAAALFVVAAAAQAQDTSQVRLRVRKDAVVTRTSGGSVALPDTTVTDTAMYVPPISAQEWYVPSGATTCSSVDVAAAQAVHIKSDLYDASTMISPDSAKIVALCAVPGQIGSGEMNVTDNRTNYAMDIIPNGKKTHTKVIVDAQTGAVLSSKQFGGLRGATGWVRESLEHKENVKKP